MALSGAVGGQPIGWDPPHSSLSSVGPLLPGSSHCFSRPGKFRHVAAGSASPGACHLGQRGGRAVVPTYAIFTEMWMSPFSLRASILLQSFPQKLAWWHSVSQMPLASCGDPGSHAVVAPSQLVPYTYRAGMELSEDLECRF